MSVELSLQLADLNHRIEKLAGVETGELLSALAAEGESQTRRRISEEKTSPDGSPWPDWSEDYAQTRHGGHSLLESEGYLLDSITADSDTTTAAWGSNLVQAAALQFGYPKRNLPAREYLGVSEDNRADFAALIDDWIDRHLGD